MTKKLANITATIWTVSKGDINKDAWIVGRSSKKHRIHCTSETRGVIINDGREVHKNKAGHWCYQPR